MDLLPTRCLFVFFQKKSVFNNIHDVLCAHKKEGENNDKFFTHPRNAKALAAYLFAHNHLFYMMELLTGLLLMMLSLCEAPAVPSLRLDVYVSASTHTPAHVRFAVKERLIPL